MAKQGTSTAEPKLRFPDFRKTQFWSLHQLAEACDLYQPETVSSNNFTADGKHFVYGAGGVIGRLDRFNHELPEVIIGCRGVCGNVSLTEPESWITGNAMVISPKGHDLSKLYLYHALSASDFSPVVSGSAQPQITRQGLSRFVIAVPENLLEQRKIADCLTSLDEVIAAQRRKIDALKAHKRSLMQQLFPREGDACPRTRFPDFRDHWKEFRLGDLCDGIYSGRDKSESEGDFDLYGSTGIIGKTAVPSHSGPHILVARVGANAGLLNKVEGKFGVTDNTLVISLKSSVNIDFVFHYLGSVGINRLIFGSGQPLITGTILKNLPVFVPGDVEQRKVSAGISSLNNLIVVQSGMYETLLAQKRGLMQRLFPSVDVQL